MRTTEFTMLAKRANYLRSRNSPPFFGSFQPRASTFSFSFYSFFFPQSFSLHIITLTEIYVAIGYLSKNLISCCHKISKLVEWELVINCISVPCLSSLPSPFSATIFSSGKNQARRVLKLFPSSDIAGGSADFYQVESRTFVVILVTRNFALLHTRARARAPSLQSAHTCRRCRTPPFDRIP